MLDRRVNIESRIVIVERIPVMINLYSRGSTEKIWEKAIELAERNR